MSPWDGAAEHRCGGVFAAVLAGAAATATLRVVPTRPTKAMLRLLQVAPLAGASAPTAAAGRTNLLVIIVDNLRIGAHGDAEVRRDRRGILPHPTPSQSNGAAVLMMDLVPAADRWWRRGSTGWRPPHNALRQVRARLGWRRHRHEPPFRQQQLLSQSFAGASAKEAMVQPEQEQLPGDLPRSPSNTHPTRRTTRPASLLPPGP